MDGGDTKVRGQNQRYAPCGCTAVGRLSYLIRKFNGAYQDETITKYDDAARSLSIYATIVGFPSFAPVRGYSSDVFVTPIDEKSSTVSWNSVADLRLLGYLTYPAMKKTLNSGFIRNLEEIKHYVETGNPHPRKIEKIKSEALALQVKSA